MAEEGYDYVADWVLDDQPVWLKTRGRPILNIPYTQECNDVAMMLIQRDASIGVSVNATNSDTSTATATVIPN